LKLSANAASSIINTNNIANISSSNIISIIKNFEIEPQIDTPICIGIDDFAFRKGLNYGTIICDLETHKVIDILENRDSSTVESWLKQHPSVDVISRDGSITYKSAITSANSKIIQISDRFHFIRNFLDALKKDMKSKMKQKLFLNDKAPNNEIKLTKKTLIEKEKEIKINNKWELILQVQELNNKGVSQRKISKELGLSRDTVRKYVTLNEPLKYTRLPRGSKLDRFKDTIHKLFNKKEKGKQIFSIIQNDGYEGSLALLNQYLTRLRKGSTEIDLKHEQKESVSLNKIIKIIYKNDKNRNSKEKDLLIEVCNYYPMIKKFYDLRESYAKLILMKNIGTLDEFIEGLKASEFTNLKRYANGISKDIEAVKMGIISQFSNGLLEGCVNKLKTIKRIMYGKASFQLLRKKVMSV
jgi:transposase